MSHGAVAFRLFAKKQKGAILWNDYTTEPEEKIPKGRILNKREGKVFRRIYKDKNTKNIICLFIIAVGVMLFCTKSSPLYPFNDWGDANIYFTIGKGVIHGQVPYRDLFDYKGPLIYMLYGIGGMISERTFFGVWLLEILAAAFFLIYSYKTVLLLCKNKVLLLMPAFAAIIYAANHMRHGGSAEEFCIPFLVYGLYISVKWLKRQEMVSNREVLFIGITSGCVLWTKYTMLGFYVAWIIIPAGIMIYRKQWTKLFRTLMTIGIGVVLVTIPILLYFGVNHSLKDLVTVYFYNNIFLYAGESLSLVQLLQRTFWNLLKAAWHNLFVFGLIGLGAIWLVVKKEYLLLLQFLLCAAGLTATVLSAPTIHGYYSMCFSVFAVFGVGAMGELLKFPKMTSHRAEITTAVLSSFFMICFVFWV